MTRGDAVGPIQNQYKTNGLRSIIYSGHQELPRKREHTDRPTQKSLRSQRRQKDSDAGYILSFCWGSHKLSGACSCIAAVGPSVPLGGRRHQHVKNTAKSMGTYEHEESTHRDAIDTLMHKPTTEHRAVSPVEGGI